MNTKEYRNNTFDYIKTQILNSPLNQIYDLSKIDWELAWKESQNSLCVKAWELWDSGIYSTSKIGNILNIDRNTVREYLKRGKKCGKCSYTKEKAILEAKKKAIKTRWG